MSRIPKELEELLNRIVDMVELSTPARFDLKYLSSVTKVNKNTLYKHLISNYKEGEDYFVSPKGGKIFVARDTAIKIRRRYVA